MAGFFSKLKGSASSTSPSYITAPSGKHNKKDAEPEPEITPLQKMLQNAGPLKGDGSDKFFGMENFGNTCYCNSIVQALYYSVPFREHVVSYPPHSPYDTPTGHPKLVLQPPIRAQIQLTGAPTFPTKAKGVSAAEAMKKRNAINAGQTVAPPVGQRPEDKPDSPEYKKKHAMIAGPVLEINYANAPSYGMEESTYTALKDVFMALIGNPSRSGVLSPARFLEIFKRENEMFRTSMHQDAHEFYGLVLNSVITKVEENAQKMKEVASPREGLVEGVQAAVSSAAHAMGLTSGQSSPGTGWVHDIFEGVLTSETKCLTCETASQRDETFLDLSIDTEEHSSITSCLRNFSAEEMLCQRNKFHCDNCGGLQEAEKRMKIKRLPKVLTLHLKRFKYTEDMTQLKKSFHRVAYPYYLRMFNTTDETEDPDRLYELYAVVVHIGSNAFHGHYVSIIKTQDRGWLLFDDEMVEPVDKHYVRNFFGNQPGQACAYVLFYQETTFAAMRREQDAEGLAEVALASKGAGIALGHSAPGGTYPAAKSEAVAIHTQPEEQQEFVSLNNVVSSPLPAVSRQTTQQPLAHATTTAAEVPSKFKSKEGKASKKEAEKAKKVADKVAEKERVKAEEKRFKDLHASRKDTLRQREEETKQALALSKKTALEEEERRKRDAAAATQNEASIARASTYSSSSNGGQQEEEKKGFMGSLSRSHKGSKSMSRKSFGFLAKDKPAVNNNANGSGDSAVAVEGSEGPQTPERHVKSAKDSRFSFSLGRKKSSLMNP
ncbi:U1biquitin-specific peptidase-like protein [Calycina marina]|uniref:Ubiquitin carboxyl-terminal hydrolase n=1 Tax=Calycina marina TaxID=1763456 RepID=A0A9P8CF58_9HELO|nr:U1biquitin-specific peptidase-like protein [Calycina marina]